MKTIEKTKVKRTTTHITAFAIDLGFIESLTKSISSYLPEQCFFLKNSREFDGLTLVGYGLKICLFFMFCIIIYVLASFLILKSETLYSYRHG